MSSSGKERMLDLLADQILFGLNEEELAELKELERLYPQFKDDNSLELAATQIGLTNLDEIEPMPAHLYSKILQDADNFFEKKEVSETVKLKSEEPELPFANISEEVQKTFEFEPKRPFLQWFGWAFAGVAVIALLFSIWLNVQKPKEVFVEMQPKVPTVAEQYNILLSSAKDLQKAAWINPKNDKEILGEVVWSDTEQKGFMKFKGLAANDANKETYQLWIFDETQSEKTPIDGGIFDINDNGEVLIPIDAKLKFKNPKLFAVTVEKPGGVVVSGREKIVAVAKI